MTWQINLSTPSIPILQPKDPLMKNCMSLGLLHMGLYIIKLTILRHTVAIITSLICHGNYGLQKKSTLLGWLDLPQATVA